MLRYMPKYGSSMSKRPCCAGFQLRSRLLSTSAWSTSIAAGASTHAERSSTASAASSVKPCSNTEHCATAARSREQAEAFREPIDELGRRQHADARRGELDRERQPVEQRDDALDRGAVR